MNNPSVQRLQEICEECTGVSLINLPRVSRQAAWGGICELIVASYADAWPDAAATRDEVEAIIDDIQRLAKRIRRLHRTRAQARNFAPDVLAIDARFEAALVADEYSEELGREWREQHARPKEAWVDYAALAHIENLSAALRPVAAQACAAALWRAHGSGSGRRPRHAPYQVALLAARVYSLLTGEDPGFWNAKDRPTPYGHMLKSLFSELGIKADTRRPAEWP